MPDLDFQVEGAEAVPHAATPLLALRRLAFHPFFPVEWSRLHFSNMGFGGISSIGADRSLIPVVF